MENEFSQVGGESEEDSKDNGNVFQMVERSSEVKTSDYTLDFAT